ncbi:hypothetical protein [Hyphococcus sp.]|nr:MAG: hypothetical protein DHS20C04_09510 [Marinicaulis sp.]
MAQDELTPRMNGDENLVQIGGDAFSLRAEKNAGDNLDTQGRRQQQNL